MSCPHHRRQIAAEVAPVADIQGQHIKEVVAQTTGLVQPDRRYAQALLPDLGRGRIVTAMSGATDIALMRPRDRPVQSAIAVEDRYKSCHVRQVAPAVIGIIQQDDVARPDIVESLLDRQRCPRKGTDMDWNMVGLRNQTAVRITNREREVAAGVEDLRVGCAKHGLAHFRNDRAQPVLNNGACDGIDFG